MGKKTLLNAKEIEITLHRLAFQLLENHRDFSNSVLIGIQPRGVDLLNKLVDILKKDQPDLTIAQGQLDITFFRDDFRRREEPLEANRTSINTILEKKRVVLIDDVLYTGRSIRAALTAIESYGRPDDIELLVLIDRRFSRNLPIQPTYLGKQVDALNDEKVMVDWKQDPKKNSIYLINKPV